MLTTKNFFFVITRKQIAKYTVIANQSQVNVANNIAINIIKGICTIVKIFMLANISSVNIYCIISKSAQLPTNICFPLIRL